MHQTKDNGFDRVASFYDPLARLVFRDALLHAQAVLLPYIKEHSSVLIVGGGSGWLLMKLLEQRKNLRILYLDASSEMIRLAQDRTSLLLEKSHCTVEFRTGTEHALLSRENFDVVVTPFLLDLFPNSRLTDLMARLRAALHEKGCWLFTDFWPVQQPPPLWQRLLLKAMYLFFGAVSGVKASKLPDFGYHFNQLGMRQNFSADFYRGMIQSKVFTRQTA